jgi:hypothetical protein
MRVIALSVALAATLLVPAGPVRGQVGPEALEACREYAFSTEEDFVTHRPEPPDGNPIISDGDLLGPGGQICARNADLLLGTFDVTQDLGLDAADVIDVDDYLVAFSTELDSPHGDQFTAGDLLTTGGAIIPNVALTHRFQLGYDIGLDAIQFAGELKEIIAFLDEILQYRRDDWLQNPGLLYQMLDRREIDIWFSTEGTNWRPEERGFLDGDLLSARHGVVVAENGALLPATVPADIRDKGVDFGLDAFASLTRDLQSARERGYFSTEILFEGEPSFTDGDVLTVGDGIATTNDELVAPFEPAAKELGLDALSARAPTPEVCRNAITEIGGLKTHVSSIGTDGLATLWYPTKHPFGDHIPIWGTICDDTIRFRVLYDDLGDGPDYPVGDPIAVPWANWKLRDLSIFHPTGCTPGWPLDWGTSDPNGWYDGPLFRTYRDLGGSNDCNDDLALTNWDTGPAANPNAASPATPKVPDGLYAVWLEWETVGGIDRELMPHNVRVDNEYTKIQDLEIPAGEGHCPEYSGTDTSFMVRGQFSDDHFWAYRLRINGDCYPGSGHYYTQTHYYDVTSAAAHLDDTGTTPDGTVVDLHVVDLTDLAASPIACAYSIELRVWDRTIIGRFNQNGGPWDGHFRSWISDDRYFTYTP